MDKLLVPIDGSECSLHALDVAVTLAKSIGGEVIVCNVVDFGKVAALTGGEATLLQGAYEQQKDEGHYLLDEATKRIGGAVPSSQQLAEGAPIEQIHQLAEQLAPRFVVIGSHGRAGIQRMVLGSVAEGVARGCCVPVLIVPAENEVHYHEKVRETSAAR